MSKYQLTKTTITIENKEKTSYGIRCKSQTIQDISTDKSFVESIILTLNSNDVSEIHFHEIIEDCLNMNAEDWNIEKGASSKR